MGNGAIKQYQFIGVLIRYNETLFHGHDYMEYWTGPTGHLSSSSGGDVKFCRGLWQGDREGIDIRGIQTSNSELLSLGDFNDEF